MMESNDLVPDTASGAEIAEGSTIIERLAAQVHSPLPCSITPHFIVAPIAEAVSRRQATMRLAALVQGGVRSPLIEAAREIAADSLSPVALTREYLARIAAGDEVIGAFAHLDLDGAVAMAAERSEELKRGCYRGVLHGIPLVIKDVIDVEGMPTRANSHVRGAEPAAADAACVRKLREAGAVIIGKVVTHEFAYAGPPEDLPFGASRNPWNLDYDTGGSSSGSAAAIMAGFCAGALGTDTGGSIRNPVSYCGGVGLKPTYGRVGRSGILPLSWSLDHCGPMARTVGDCAAIFQAIAGHDPADPHSVTNPVADFTDRIGRPLTGLRVGLLRGFFEFEGGASEDIRHAIDAVAGDLQGLGCCLVDVALPPNEMFSACGRLILLSEAYAFHRQDLAERPEAFGRWTRDRLRTGSAITASDYIQALRMRSVLRMAVDGAFEKCDIILTVSARSAAPKLEWGGPDGYWNAPSPTIAFNVTGHPALALCGGFSSASLPLGFQLVGRAYDEATLFQVAHAYENATRWMDTPIPRQF
ncbi:amidase [Bosea sp. 2KB_26]|uniref:amidase n=1 Tax=Bosea sp. 2KB_26 TaxID=3237475 RepID=UPI003F8E6D07